ncbi:MAG: protein kinase [Pirellulaceae bacterium]|nr:MAG: protein kinase [Pirellulaceae bacterium]
MTQSRIGSFILEEKLPGAGCTWRAIHGQQRVAVALKVFAAAFGTTPTMRQTFMDECATLKMLHHRSLVRCFGGGFDGQHAYLVHELVEGESLSRLLERRGRLPWEMVVEQLRQAAEALEFLHERELFHLALQPDKWMITHSDSVKLLDVRPARLSGTLLAGSGERSLEAMRYWAPEQFSGTISSPGLVDIYALGCIAFQMLTGKPPFTETEPERLAEAHARQPPERVALHVLDCPVWLDALVSQMLEKDAERRVRSPRALLMALDEAERHIAQGTTVAEHAARGVSPLRAPGDARQATALLRPKTKRRPVRPARQTPVWERAWFLVAALVVLIGIGVVLAWPPSEEKLFRRAEQLLQSDEPGAALRARDDYLLPLLRRFPDGKYAEQARQWLDKIDMDLAEARLRSKLRLGRPLENETERLLAEAWQYRQFGDHASAAEKFRAMLQVLPDDKENRPYRLLAERELKAIEQQAFDNRSQFLIERLADARRLADEGKRSEAEAIWRSIISLYDGQPELMELVEQAREALRRAAADAQDGAQRGDSSIEPPSSHSPP